MSQAASLPPPASGTPERPAPVSGYATRDVATLLGLTAAQVRSYIRDGFLAPGQGERGEYRFTFQDLILLRTAKGLVEARVPRRRIRLALQNLREQLPEGRPLTGVRITSQGHQVVVRDGRELWNPESGQTLLDFSVADLERAAALVPVGDVRRKKEKKEEEAPATADGWFAHGIEREEAGDGEGAAAAYREALAIDPDLSDVHLNLGRLLHEKGDLTAAEEHYRRARALDPAEPVAAFDLGVVLQDQERWEEAAAAYEATLALDASFADAHYNLSAVYEALGHPRSALRHLKSYKALTGG